MKKLFFSFSVLIIIGFACDDDTAEPMALTGLSVTYPLFSGSAEWGYEGDVTFSERKDGFSVIDINLTGPKGTSKFPVHLHFGSYSAEADMAAMLLPVDASTGRSKTFISELASGVEITYAELANFNGHIKIHLGDGDDKNVIIAYGNIGSNPPTVARANLATCTSW